MRAATIVSTENADVSGSAPGRSLRGRFVGLERCVPLFGGARRPCVNFDNAATTPALKDGVDAVTEFLEWYGSVHRGAGAKSHVSTHTYDACRETVARFVGADPAHDAVIFTRSATDSINMLSCALAECHRRVCPITQVFRRKPLVLCTAMEHHSNLLPWRRHARAGVVALRPDGAIDLDQLESRLKREKVRLVAVTGASNVTGLIPPIRRIARLAHQYGAEMMVDAAQLVAHRSFKMGKPGDPERVDYVAFSAHKMYAPFGAGVLVGPKKTFAAGLPDRVGGGVVKLVTPDETIWADLPAREEPGTPNVVGAVALAKAIAMLEEVGFERIAAHDAALRDRMVERLRAVPGIRLYGQPAPAGYSHVGVLAFLADKVNHGLLAAALGHEWGVAVRNGCFCAHPYMMQLLGVTLPQLSRLVAQARANDHSEFPGLVRVSFGLYNTVEEVDYAAEAIRSVVELGPRARYRLDRPTGEYLPEEGLSALDSAFTI